MATIILCHLLTAAGAGMMRDLDKLARVHDAAIRAGLDDASATSCAAR